MPPPTSRLPPRPTNGDEKWCGIGAGMHVNRKRNLRPPGAHTEDVVVAPRLETGLEGAELSVRLYERKAGTDITVSIVCTVRCG